MRKTLLVTESFSEELVMELKSEEQVEKVDEE